MPSSQESGFEPGKYPPPQEASQTKTTGAGAVTLLSRRRGRWRRRGVPFMVHAVSAGFGSWIQALGGGFGVASGWLAGRNHVPSRWFTPCIPLIYLLYTSCIGYACNWRCPGDGRRWPLPWLLELPCDQSGALARKRGCSGVVPVLSILRPSIRCFCPQIPRHSGTKSLACFPDFPIRISQAVNNFVANLLPECE